MPRNPSGKRSISSLLDSAALHIDETPIRCLKSDKTNGYMWAMSSADNGSTLYYWQNSRSADALDYLLRHGQQKDGLVYEGAILSDGYGGYESWKKISRMNRGHSGSVYPRVPHIYPLQKTKSILLSICNLSSLF